MIQLGNSRLAVCLLLLLIIINISASEAQGDALPRLQLLHHSRICQELHLYMCPMVTPSLVCDINRSRLQPQKRC
jgi:hypothetical protein